MKRSEKEQLVTELRDKIKGANALYYTDFTGLNVKKMTDLRRKFRKAGVEYVVIKNTLALKAVNESGLTGTRLKGPTGVVVAKDGIVAAKLLTEFAKANDARPVFKGGLYEGASVDEAMVKKLASLPTRDEAYSQLLGAFNSVLMMFALALEALKTQKTPAEAAPAAAPEAAAPTAPEAAAPAAPETAAPAAPEAAAPAAPPAAPDAGSEGTTIPQASA